MGFKMRQRRHQGTSSIWMSVVKVSAKLLALAFVLHMQWYLNVGKNANAVGKIETQRNLHLSSFLTDWEIAPHFVWLSSSSSSSSSDQITASQMRRLLSRTSCNYVRRSRMRKFKIALLACFHRAIECHFWKRNHASVHFSGWSIGRVVRLPDRMLYKR